jgi:hypothetical protein
LISVKAGFAHGAETQLVAHRHGGASAMDANLNTSAAHVLGPSHRLGELARQLVSAPFVYGLIAPIALLDAAVTGYQAVCFPLWRMPRVRRSEHLIIDRQKLPYLNGAQKLNCFYCGYANGVLSYAREVASRTEQYWCPIKHSTEPPKPHPRYAAFVDYADAAGFAQRADMLRIAVQEPPKKETTSVEDMVEALSRRLAPYPAQE